MGTIKIKQKKVIGLGEIYEAFVTALPILSAVQFISILAVLYNQIQPTLVTMIPGITLLKFLIILSLILIGAMVLVYKFLIPSIWTFRGKQLYGFESELMEEVKMLRKEIEELRKEKEK
jgi:hypothetical protein